MRRHPSRRSEDQMPQREAVGRPVQQPAQKHPGRPIAMPISTAGAVTLKYTPAGIPAPASDTVKQFATH